jgi:hypothetical protein
MSPTRDGRRAEIITEAIDFYHAAQQLNAFAQLAFSSHKAAQRWYKKQRGLLKQGKVDAVLHNMQGHLAQAKGTQRQDMQTIYEYFDTHRQRMAYKQLAETMLHARCWWAAGAWEQFRDLVLTIDLRPALSK